MDVRRSSLLWRFAFLSCCAQRPLFRCWLRSVREPMLALPCGWQQRGLIGPRSTRLLYACGTITCPCGAIAGARGSYVSAFFFRYSVCVLSCFTLLLLLRLPYDSVCRRHELQRRSLRNVAIPRENKSLPLFTGMGRCVESTAVVACAR